MEHSIRLLFPSLLVWRGYYHGNPSWYLKHFAITNHPKHRDIPFHLKRRNIQFSADSQCQLKHYNPSNLLHANLRRNSALDKIRKTPVYSKRIDRIGWYWSQNIMETWNYPYGQFFRIRVFEIGFVATPVTYFEVMLSLSFNYPAR